MYNTERNRGAHLGIISKEAVITESAHVECNEKKVNILIENFHRITLTSFFPTIIANLIEEGTYSSSSPFKEFHFVITHRAEIKKICSEEAYYTMKLWINYIFGKLKNFNADHKLVYTYANTVLSSILEFAEEWYYIDTDEVWIRLKPAIRDDLEKSLTELNFRYEIHKVEFAIFQAKKKFTAQLLENGEKSFLSRGFKRESFLR